MSLASFCQYSCLRMLRYLSSLITSTSFVVTVLPSDAKERMAAPFVGVPDASREKVPVTPEYVVGRKRDELLLRNYQGKTFRYREGK